MKKRIISFLLLLALVCSLNAVCAEEMTQTIAPFISVTHTDDAEQGEAYFTSTAATQPVSQGNKKYVRRQITVLDLSQINVPDGMMLDEAVYSLYCTTNFEIVDTTLGVYALDISDIDFSTTRLTYETVPENGELIASFDMPARKNGETYDKYMDFDLSTYVKAAVEAGNQYVGFAVVQTAKTAKGGIFVGTIYHESPPKMTFGFRERNVVVKSHTVMAEKNGSQEKTVNTVPWFSASHWASDENRYTDTTFKDWAMTMGSGGTNRRVINVLDLSAFQLPEGTTLDEITYSLYGITNYELEDSIVGVWALDLSNIDLSDGLKYADVPANGKMIASINMPARQNGETYNRYMNFDLTDYVNTAIAAKQQYVGFSIQQVANCKKGGMSVAPTWHANPPKVSLKYQEPISGKAEQNTLCEGELEYNVTLLNETNETKQVRLMWAEVSGNTCVNVVASDAISLEANGEETISLTQAATNTDNMVRFFVVEDTGTVIRPLVDEKYELTKDGWK